MKYEKYFEMSYEEQQDEIDRAHKALTKDELEVVNAIENQMTKTNFPVGYFEDNTLDALNKEFGAHDDVQITKKIADYLSLVHAHVIEMDDMVDQYDDLPEEDE